MQVSFLYKHRQGMYKSSQDQHLIMSKVECIWIAQVKQKIQFLVWHTSKHIQIFWRFSLHSYTFALKSCKWNSPSRKTLQQFHIQVQSKSKQKYRLNEEWWIGLILQNWEFHSTLQSKCYLLEFAKAKYKSILQLGLQ